MVDIKDWLVAAAGTLASGEVVKPATLSYLDAMNALEIMDPAMDAGTSFSPRGQFDPHAALSPCELVWIMDEMAAREVAWLRGSTMAQTLFTSLHYHNALDLAPTPGLNPGGIQFQSAELACVALRAFVLSYAKAVDIVYAALLDTNGPARDGEDVWLDSYGIPLETTETPEEVVGYLEQIIYWLEDRVEGEDGMWEQVILRLRFRKSWIDALLLRHTRPPPRGIFLAPALSEVPWAFDNMTPFLRQNMPFPTVRIPTHAETWDVFSRVMAHMQAIHSVAALPLGRKEQFLRTRVADMLPIVRCVYKTVLCDTPPVEEMVDEWLSVELRQSPGVLARIDANVTGQERGMFALWRDIVGGTLHLTLAAPLANAARRRRSFLHLSETWANQAAAAARIPALADIIPVVRARAVDCALYAHLLGFALQLYSPGERRAAWWVALVLARARGEGGWESMMARAWAAVASAMVILHTIVPPPSPEPTVAQFVLRHKILLRSVGISPCAWDRARGALDASVKDIPAALETAKAWLLDAEARFAARPSPELDVRAAAADIVANITAIEGFAAGQKLTWEDGRSGTVSVLAVTGHE